ncbi:hypothetical protein M6D81_29255 [Paenibacillus sp. J5C_2022]|nr:hypothetical protein [Paenibacillus sp. J5C2022]
MDWKENWVGTVLYEPDGEEGRMLPVWLILEGKLVEHDWQGTLTVPIDAPFQKADIDEWDYELPALAVPDYVYILQANDSARLVGIHMPALRTYVESIAITAGHPFKPEDIGRLMLRISDLEEMLQLTPRSR